MIINMTTPLFNIEKNIVVKINNNNDNGKTHVKKKLDTILEGFLTKVSFFTTSSNTTNMTTLRGIARKMSPSATSSKISLD